MMSYCVAMYVAILQPEGGLAGSQGTDAQFPPPSSPTECAFVTSLGYTSPKPRWVAANDILDATLAPLHTLQSFHTSEPFTNTY